MDFRASHRHARVTARKARLVVDLVRGLPVNQALVALDRSPKRAAVLVQKVVRSAVANAEQKTGGSVDLNELVGKQDFDVCEMVQRGVSLRSFAGGGLTKKDAYVTEFVERYLDIRASGE